MKKLSAMITTLALISVARSAELKLPRDGWVSWEVQTVDNAEAWCCWSASGDDPRPQTCKLDGQNWGFGNRDHMTMDSARVYARFANGKLERLRTLAADCPVEAKTAIQALDDISTDDSARWLIGQQRSGELEHEVLASLAVHRGDVGFGALKDMALRDTNTGTRKNAIFWLALMRGAPGADIVASTMFADASPDVRRHAAFAITQSKSPHAAADLVKQGNTDADADVRAQAWFWLAHQGDAGAEAAITSAMKNDSSDHVREQAVFALSQLPEERAARALIAASQDRTLSHEQRKRAIFWLAQSKSADAQAYLEKVLAQTTPR